MLLENKDLTDSDLKFLRRAIDLAKKAEVDGNLPIGAVIVLGDDVIGEGKNSIWEPIYKPNLHAEIQAIEFVHKHDSILWSRAAEMTLYTTLEPCLMCLGTILVHRIGRVVFGYDDPHGGAICVFDHMPYAFEHLRESTEWISALLPECKELSDKVVEMAKNHKQEKKWDKSLPSLYAMIDPNFSSSKRQQALASMRKKIS